MSRRRLASSLLWLSAAVACGCSRSAAPSAEAAPADAIVAENGSGHDDAEVFEFQQDGVGKALAERLTPQVPSLPARPPTEAPLSRARLPLEDRVERGLPPAVLPISTALVESTNKTRRTRPTLDVPPLATAAGLPAPSPVVLPAPARLTARAQGEVTPVGLVTAASERPTAEEDPTLRLSRTTLAGPIVLPQRIPVSPTPPSGDRSIPSLAGAGPTDEVIVPPVATTLPARPPLPVPK